MTAWEREIERTVRENESRIRQLEKHIHYPHSEMRGELRMTEAAAARVQALNDSFKETSADYFANLDLAALKSSAARAQGQQASVDTAPMRSDVEAILTMTAFIKRLLSPEDFAYAVTLEVRNEARRALGFKEREV